VCTASFFPPRYLRPQREGHSRKEDKVLILEKEMVAYDALTVKDPFLPNCS